MAVNVFPGPGNTRFSAAVWTRPQPWSFGSVNVPEKVPPPKPAGPDIVTLTGVAVMHELPTRFVVEPVAWAFTIRMLNVAVAVTVTAKMSALPMTFFVGTIFAVAVIRGGSRRPGR